MKILVEKAVIEQALEALKKYADWRCTPETDQTVTALREALTEQERKAKYDERFERLEKFEQAEQEPVAWFVQYKNHHEFVFGNKPEFIVDGVVEPLYAAPVRTKDLTDDEINELWLTYGQGQMMYIHEKFARAVIAADREKNK